MPAEGVVSPSLLSKYGKEDFKLLGSVKNI